MTDTVRDNPSRSRYELEIDGQTVFASYRRQGDVLAITHVEAPVSLRGTGAAGRFMQGLMEVMRQQQQKVLPLCGYASAWLRRHREFADLVV
jgi:predicted GNAT family acetyltransferase